MRFPSLFTSLSFRVALFSCLALCGVVSPVLAAELLYVSSRNTPEVRAYALDLQSYTTFVDLSADPTYQFEELKGIGFDGVGNFYAAINVSGTGSIMKFTSTGTLVNPTYITNLDAPGYIDVAPNGDMLIINSGFGAATTVSKWTAGTSTLTGTFIGGLTGAVSAIFANDGGVLVSQDSSNLIAKYDASGTLVSGSFISQSNIVSMQAIIRSGSSYLIKGIDGTTFQYPVYEFGLSGGSSGTLRVGDQLSGQEPTGTYFDVASNGSLFNMVPGAAVIRKYGANGLYDTEVLAAGDVNYGIVTDVAAVPEPSAFAIGFIGLAGIAALGLRRRGKE